jgi:hypothetical protein
VHYLKKISEIIISKTYSESYKGWFISFKDYAFKIDKESEEYFNFDFSKEKDIIALIFLATIWNMPPYLVGGWENAIGIIAVVYNKNLLDINKWSSQGFIESVNENGFKDKFTQAMNSIDTLKPNILYSRGKLSLKWGEEGIFQRLHIIAKEYSFLRETLQIDEILKDNVPKLDEKVFSIYDNPRLKIDAKGNNNTVVKKSLLEVKIPLILRELKCYNKIDISGEYCCVPDSRVKKMMKIIGYKPHPGDDIDHIIKNSKTIYKYFGPFYDLPLFDFYEYCPKTKNKTKSGECNKKDCDILALRCFVWISS